MVQVEVKQSHRRELVRLRQFMLVLILVGSAFAITAWIGNLTVRLLVGFAMVALVRWLDRGLHIVVWTEQTVVVDEDPEAPEQ